jgi:CxxC motif-containing protein
MVCISCPLGCRLTVRWDEARAVEGGRGGTGWDGTGIPAEEAIQVEGNKCGKGEQYAREEILAPKRVVTATVPIRAGRAVRLPVKTTAPLVKELVPGLLNEIYRWELEAPIVLGQKLLEDIGGSGVDLVATRTVEKEA